MSVEALAVVLHHSKAKGSAKLVLLGIANHEGDGGSWPKVETLARYANVDERNVQRALERLVGSGELLIERRAGGNAKTPDYRLRNLYRVALACPPWCDRTTNHRDTRATAAPQQALEPVDKWGGDSATPIGFGPSGVAESSPQGVAVAPPLNRPTNHPSQVPASTTERASSSTSSSSSSTPAPPPVDELARVRDQLRTSTVEHLARANKPTTR